VRALGRRADDAEHVHGALAADGAAIVEAIGKVSAEARRLQHSQRAMALRRQRLSMAPDFERRCVRAVANGGGSDDSVAGVPAVGVTSFVHMEMYASTPAVFGTPLHLRWCQLKRALPVADGYFDLRALLLDAASFAVDDYSAGLFAASWGDAAAEVVGDEVLWHLLRQLSERAAAGGGGGGASAKARDAIFQKMLTVAHGPPPAEDAAEGERSDWTFAQLVHL
jgi:hypothetical protein